MQPYCFACRVLCCLTTSLPLPIQVWDTSSVALDAEAPAQLRVTAAVAAHDKDINAVAVAPNNSGAMEPLLLFKPMLVLSTRLPLCVCCSDMHRQSGSHCKGLEAAQSRAVADLERPQAWHMVGCIFPSGSSCCHGLW